MANAPATNLLECTFCGKNQNDVRKLISGPSALICDECVGLCAEIVAEGELNIGPTDFFEQRLFERRTKHIFYACPFHEPFDSIYVQHLKPAITAAGWTIERADENFATGVVIRQVWEAINTCEAVIADVTGRSANVMYEIGMSHALHKPVMMATQDENDVPFDLRHHRFVVYKTDDSGLVKFAESMVKMAKTFDDKRANKPAAVPIKKRRR